jgi:hypothetical protein
VETLRRIAAVSCSGLLLAIVFVYVDNNNIGRQVYSQQTTENVFPNNTETATEFEDVIEGNNTAALENNTDIGNPNNTLASDVETGAETAGRDVMILGEDAKTMLKNEIDNIDQVGKQDFDALLAKIRSLQIP